MKYDSITEIDIHGMQPERLRQEWEQRNAPIKESLPGCAPEEQYAQPLRDYF